MCNGVLEKHNISAKEVLRTVHTMLHHGVRTGKLSPDKQKIDDYIDETGILNIK